jgi:hypothetical protein
MLVSSHLTNRTKATLICDLSDHLGCKRMRMCGGAEIFGLTQPAACHESSVSLALLQFLRSQMRTEARCVYWEDEISIMDGLARNERWRACLADMNDAYDLAALFLRFSRAYWRGADKYSTEAMTVLRREVEQGAFEAFTDWVAPGSTKERNWEPGEWTPEPLSIARTLFGVAWCSMVFTESNASAVDVEAAMRFFRPPFQPGLVPAQIEAAPLSLPELDFT